MKLATDQLSVDVVFPLERRRTNSCDFGRSNDSISKIHSWSTGNSPLYPSTFTTTTPHFHHHRTPHHHHQPEDSGGAWRVVEVSSSGTVVVGGVCSRRAAALPSSPTSPSPVFNGTHWHASSQAANQTINLWTCTHLRASITTGLTCSGAATRGYVPSRQGVSCFDYNS